MPLLSGNSLKDRLRRGDAVVGTWSVIPSPTVAEIAASAGLDFIIIDLEHGPFSFEGAQDIIRAAELYQCHPLLRVPANEDWLILRGLEVGSHGIVVPQIATASDAERAVAAIKYFPRGRRGVSPFSRANGFTNEDSGSMAERANSNTVVILLVEGGEGIANLDEILSVPDIDVIYVGTYDLSQSAGFPGQPNHPKVVEYVEECVARIRSQHVAVGILVQSRDEMLRAYESGVQLLAYNADCAIFHHAVSEVRSYLSSIQRSARGTPVAFQPDM